MHHKYGWFHLDFIAFFVIIENNNPDISAILLTARLDAILIKFH